MAKEGAAGVDRDFLSRLPCTEAKTTPNVSHNSAGELGSLPSIIRLTQAAAFSRVAQLGRYHLEKLGLSLHVVFHPGQL